MKQKKFQCSPIVVFMILLFIVLGYITGQTSGRKLVGSKTFNLPGQQARLEDGSISLNEILVDFGENDTTESSTTVISDVTNSFQVDGLVSRLYSLEFDFTCDKPITISLDLEGIPPINEEDNGSLRIGIGLETTDGSSILNKLIEPVISEGVATIEIVPSEIFDTAFIRGFSTQSLIAKPVKEKIYTGIYHYSSFDIANGHFKVWFPIFDGIDEFFYITEENRKTLLSDLEAVYQNYLSKGYTYSKRTKWPMEVYVQSLDAEGYYSEGKIGTVGGQIYANTADYGCIYLNRNLFVKEYRRQRIKEVLAHEFFHFVQYNYATSNTGLTWLDEATATYFEWKESERMPDTTIKYWNLIYDGIYPEEDTASQGYARMPLIDYLAEKNSENFILETYKTGGANGDWVNAFHVSLQGQGNRWVNDFYNQYFLGESTSYYKPMIFYQELIRGKNAEFSHAGKALELIFPDEEYIYSSLENDDPPILASTTLAIPALGARVVALDVDTETLKSFPDDMDPVVHVEGNVVTSVYAVKGKNYIKLGEGDNIRLKDFKESIEDKMMYMVLIVGFNESGKSDIDISIQLDPMTPIESIRLSKEDTSGVMEAAFSAALSALGDISVNDSGEFSETLNYAQTQLKDSSNDRDGEKTYQIEVTNFNIEGRWDAFNLSGEGKIICDFNWETEEIFDGSTGETIETTQMEFQTNSVFSMILENEVLKVRIDVDATGQGTEVSKSAVGSPFVAELSCQGSNCGGRVDVEFSYTME
jgi:hypothetical protein